MLNRLLFGVTYAAIGALAYGWLYNYQQIAKSQQAKVEEFINAGPRFTAQDGQELCQAVREIAQNSYGFQNSGIKMPECNYLKDQH